MKDKITKLLLRFRRTQPAQTNQPLMLTEPLGSSTRALHAQEILIHKGELYFIY